MAAFLAIISILAALIRMVFAAPLHDVTVPVSENVVVSSSAAPETSDDGAVYDTDTVKAESLQAEDTPAGDDAEADTPAAENSDDADAEAEDTSAADDTEETDTPPDDNLADDVAGDADTLAEDTSGADDDSNVEVPEDDNANAPAEDEPTAPEVTENDNGENDDTAVGDGDSKGSGFDPSDPDWIAQQSPIVEQCNADHPAKPEDCVP